VPGLNFIIIGNLESKQYCPECPWCDATPRSLRSHRLADDWLCFKSENPRYEQDGPFFETSSTLSSYALSDRDPFPTPVREPSPEIHNPPSLRLTTLRTRDATRLGLPSTSCGDGILISRCDTVQSSAISKLCTGPTSRSGISVAHETYAGTLVDQSKDKEEAEKGPKENIGSGATGSGGHASSSLIPPIARLPLVSGISRRVLPPSDLLGVEHAGSGIKETSLPGSFTSSADSESDGECLATRYLPDNLEQRTSYRSPSTLSALDACPLSLGGSESAENSFPTFDPKWVAQLTDRAGPRGSVSSSTTMSKSAADSATNSSLSNQGPKRSRNNDGGPSSDGEDDAPGQPRLNLRRPQNSDASLKLACPFRKHDPGKYNLGSYRICATTPWESIMRLK
jgi:hypothetical protein